MVVDSEDIDERWTAEFHRDLFQKQSENLILLGSELFSLVQRVNAEAVAPDDRELLNYSEGRLTVR